MSMHVSSGGGGDNNRVLDVAGIETSSSATRELEECLW
jgi:hypothetical protein